MCPDCKLTELEFTVEQLFAGEHISAAVSELQKDGDINFIVTGFGDMLLGMPDALSGAGFEVPAISQAGTPLNREMIAYGTMQVADVALPTSYLGWRAVDVGFRAIAGQDPGTFTQPPNADFDGPSRHRHLRRAAAHRGSRRHRRSDGAVRRCRGIPGRLQGALGAVTADSTQGGVGPSDRRRTDPVLRRRGDLQDVSGTDRARRRHAHGGARAGARAARSERIRQVDADQDPRRLPPRRPGRAGTPARAGSRPR